jgi:hypothetical protein
MFLFFYFHEHFSKRRNNVTVIIGGEGEDENDVTITIFYLVSNACYFLSLNDPALVWIKYKFQNDILGQMLQSTEPKPHKNVRQSNCAVDIIVLFFKSQRPVLDPKKTM